MRSPTTDASEQPQDRPGKNRALMAVVVVLAGVGILWWGVARSRSLNPAAEPSLEERIASLEALVKQAPTPENYVNLSLAYANAKRFREQVAAAQEAIKLKPDFAEGYNNLAAGYEDLRMWDEAIAAAEHAIKLKPEFQLARNNLAGRWSRKRRANSQRRFSCSRKPIDRSGASSRF